MVDSSLTVVIMLRWLKTADSKATIPDPVPGLPDPKSEVTIEDARLCFIINELVAKSPGFTTSPRSRPRGVYSTYTDTQRADIARYAALHGVAHAARHFTTVLGKKVSETTVRSMKQKLTTSIKRKACAIEEVQSLPPAKRGRPTLVPDHLDSIIQQRLHKIRDEGGVVNRNIVIAVAKGVIQHKNRGLLAENGGFLDLTRTWSESMMERMSFVKRKGTKTARKLPADFETSHQRIVDAITTHNIPPELAINMDQTIVKIVPTDDWTMAESGSKQVSITGLDDKRQIP